MHGHVRARVGRGLKEVRRADDARTRDATQVAHDDLLVAVRGVQAGADGGCAKVSLQEQFGVVDKAFVLLAQRVREGGKLAAKRHRDGVLQLRAAHRENVAELGDLLVEGVGELVDGLAQAVDLAPQGDTEGRRVRVVRGLGTVDVIVGVDDVVAALLLPQDLEREVRNDLVRVHVNGSAGTALELVDGELVHAAAVLDDLVASGDDRLSLGGLHRLELHVRHGAGLLHLRERTDELRRFVDGATRDLIVLDCSQRVDAPVRVLGYFAGAEQIFFGAGQRCSFRLFASRFIPAGAPPW